MSGTGADKRTSTIVDNSVKEKNVSKSNETDSADSGKLNNLLEGIGRFDSENQQADDLKVINGIGPKMEEALNNLGIFTYVQVSKMTKKEYDLLDEITGSFPGRAERDDWSGQAKNLLNN